MSIRKEKDSSNMSSYSSKSQFVSKAYVLNKENRSAEKFLSNVILILLIHLEGKQNLLVCHECSE